MLFVRSLWKMKCYFLVVTGLLLLTTEVWEKQLILTAPGVNCFFNSCELLVPFFVVLPVSFTLYDNYEIELGLINGVPTVKLMLCKFFAIIVAILVPFVAVNALVRDKYYRCRPEEIRIPLELPENFQIYLVLSVIVTTLFFASLFLLLRVALRNCYAPVGLGILAFSFFQPRMLNINDLSLPFKSALFYRRQGGKRGIYVHRQRRGASYGCADPAPVDI